MRLSKLSANETEIRFGNTTVFFSYNTPVACHIAGEGYYRTTRSWSKTTAKHITRWLNGNAAEEKPQEFFDKLAHGEGAPQ